MTGYLFCDKLNVKGEITLDKLYKNMKNVVELTNVNKRINGKDILCDVNIKLEKGKIYGLVGANGSGKSTLIKSIIGLYKTQGKVIINGYDIRKDYKNIIGKIGVIVDYVSFYEYLSAYENLRYFAYLYEVPFERVKEVMKIVKLDMFDKKIVKHYSLGMKQRLGLAISLLRDPEILILDEPMNGLDPKGIQELRNLLLDFDDKTIIISSHLISEIEKIVDEVVFINNHKVITKKLDNNSIRKHIRLKVNNYNALKNISPSLCESESVYMSDEEVASLNEKLVKNNVKVYRIEEDNSLEKTLLKMMDGEKDE